MNMERTELENHHLLSLMKKLTKVGLSIGYEYNHLVHMLSHCWSRMLITTGQSNFILGRTGDYHLNSMIECHITDSEST